MVRNIELLNRIKSLAMKKMTVHAIARKEGIDRSLVNYYLRKLGLLKKRRGYIAEKRVSDLLTGLGQKVEMMKNNSPYDLMANGLKIDVKSSSLNTDKRGVGYYNFQLQDVTERKKIKKISEEVDLLYLVFKDSGEVFELKPTEIQCSLGLKMPSQIAKSKYFKKMKYIGNIGSIPVNQ